MSAADRAPAKTPGTPGPVIALLERLGWRPGKPAPTAEDGGPAGADLMDHARAFEPGPAAGVMTRRADTRAGELSPPLEALVAAFAESEHSRLPVYRESLDDPVGVAHLKDVFRLMAEP